MSKLISIFLDLVKIYSPSGQEEKVIKYVFDYFKSLGLKPNIDNYGNLILRVLGEGTPLLLGAHLDTVEPGRNISPQIKDGIIRSNGNTILGADNKVAVAAIIEAISLVSKKKIQIRPLEIVFTRSEETGNFGAINLDFSKIKAKEGYTFDSANKIGAIIKESPYYNRFDISLIGNSIHAAVPEKGINVIDIFRNSKIKLGRINSKTLANVGILKGGFARNTVPGLLELAGEVRSLNKKEVELYSKEIIEAFKKSVESFGGKIKYKIIQENKGYAHSVNDMFVRHTIEVMRELELKSVLTTSWGCSDANIFNEHDIKVLNLGNGSKNPHTVKESVSIKEIEKLKKLILSLATYKL